MGNEIPAGAVEAAVFVFYGTGWSLEWDEGAHAGLRAKARAALAAADAAMWQPIATAPRDGTTILATIRVFIKGEYSYTQTDKIWFDGESGEIHNDCYDGWEWEHYEYWRPLPAGPVSP